MAGIRHDAEGANANGACRKRHTGELESTDSGARSGWIPRAQSTEGVRLRRRAASHESLDNKFCNLGFGPAMSAIELHTAFRADAKADECRLHAGNLRGKLQHIFELRTTSGI